MLCEVEGGIEMSYINETCILTVKVKQNTSWNSEDTDSCFAQVQALYYLLKLNYAEKFDVEIEYS